MIRRLAISKEHFDVELDVRCSPESKNAFVDVLARQASTGWLEKLLEQTARIEISGSAWWPLVAQHETAETDAIVMAAVKKSGLLAAPRVLWSELDVKLTLYDVDDARVGCISIDDDLIEVGIAATGMVRDEITLDADLKLAFKTLFQAHPPTTTAILANLPLPHTAWKPNEASRWSLLPEWTVSAFLRWASYHLRLHVLFSASSGLDDNCFGSTIGVFVERAIMEHVKSSRGTAARKITMQLHDSVGCICKNHRACGDAAHTKSRIVLHFCGCCHDINGSCPFHPKDDVESAVCTHGLRMLVQCVHAGDSEVPIVTTCVDVPLKPPFARCFAAACVELTETERTEADAKQIAAHVATEFNQAIDNDTKERESIDINLMDSMVESMLRSGELFYGLPQGKKGGQQMLRRKRKHSGNIAVPAWMKACMFTHSHLFQTRD